VDALVHYAIRGLLLGDVFALVGRRREVFVGSVRGSVLSQITVV